jgi:hypothetical protein
LWLVQYGSTLPARPSQITGQLSLVSQDDRQFPIWLEIAGQLVSSDLGDQAETDLTFLLMLKLGHFKLLKSNSDSSMPNSAHQVGVMSGHVWSRSGRERTNLIRSPSNPIQFKLRQVKEVDSFRGAGADFFGETGWAGVRRTQHEHGPAGSLAWSMVRQW